MSFEIQDSDDDFSVTSPTRPGEEDEPSLVTIVPEVVASRSESTNETTSTDRLVREIHHAQRQLIRSSPAPSTYTPPEPKSSPLRALKRQKTAHSPQLSTPETKLGRTKTIKTYGSFSECTRGLLESGSSLFDDLKADEQRSIGITITPREDEALERATLDKTWDLPPSIRNDFQEHEPVSMFPDLSSTVPDNSITQQRLIEEALSNQTMPPPIQQADEPAASTTSTIPWSTYLESPEQKTQTSFKITQISQMLIPDEPGLEADPKLVTKNAFPPLDPPNTPLGSPANATRLSKTPTSSSSKLSSSKLRRTKTAGPKTTSGRSPGELDDELAMEEPKSTARRRKSHTVVCPSRDINDDLPAAPKVVDRALAEQIVAMLSTTPLGPPSQTDKQASVQVPDPVLQKKQKRRQEEEISRNEDASQNPDDFVVDLLKDQYKPRPSRSRSTRIAEDTSIDYSKRPEKVATSNLKRRKTMNEVPLGSPSADVDPEKIAQLGSMGFTPRQTKAALIESSGNIERAIDHMIAKSSGGKENSPSKPSKTRSKSTRKPEMGAGPSQSMCVEVTQRSGDKNFHPTTDDPEVVEQLCVENQEKEKGLEDQIVLDCLPLPATKPTKEDVPTAKLSVQKRRRDKVIDSDEEDDFVAEPEPSKPAPKSAAKRTKSLPARKTQILDETENLVGIAPIHPPKEAKRGRGRPKKVVEAVADAEPSEPHVSDSKLDKADANEYIRPKSLETVEKIAVESKQPKEPTHPPDSISKNEANPPSTPDQQSGTSQKSAPAKVVPQHSPINKSKVPLRVGLSRKKRIAPLLKIIKK